MICRSQNKLFHFHNPVSFCYYYQTCLYCSWTVLLSDTKFNDSMNFALFCFGNCFVVSWLYLFCEWQKSSIQWILSKGQYLTNAKFNFSLIFVFKRFWELFLCFVFVFILSMTKIINSMNFVTLSLFPVRQNLSIKLLTLFVFIWNSCCRISNSVIKQHTGRDKKVL